MFTRLVLDYGHGWEGESFTDGGEVDCIDRWGIELEEKLRITGIPIEVLQTRKRPGITPEQRLEWIDPNDLVLHMHVGIPKAGKAPRQSGCVYVNSEDMGPLGMALCDSIDAWIRQSGVDYSQKSKVLGAKFPWFLHRGTSVQVEPFILGSHGSAILERRFSHLGSVLCEVLWSYLTAQNQALKSKFHRCVDR
jgi:hypothetical protein